MFLQYLKQDIYRYSCSSGLRESRPAASKQSRLKGKSSRRTPKLVPCVSAMSYGQETSVFRVLINSKEVGAELL